MAHPKLTTVVGRSFLTATAAALIGGPLAVAGAAQTLDDATNTLKMTCEEAFKTEDAELIKQFCTEAELAELEEAAGPLEKSVDDVTTTTEKTVTDTTKTVEKTVSSDGGDGGQGGTTDPGTVLGDDGTKDGGSSPTQPKTGTDVGSTGDGGFTGVDEGSNGGIEKGRAGAGRNNSSQVEAQSYGYNADGPFRPGMRSYSSLTLQPFASPLVSVPPVYELPQIAQQLFGGDTAAGAEDPMVAASATSASSPAGYTATSADPTGWLAATATGLIMLVGAGHAINGGRTPKRQRA